MHVRVTSLHFIFRCKKSLLWDVAHLARNAQAYNEEDSDIVNNAKVIVHALHKFIR